MKILVIRFSSIGDIVLTTPVLRCLKQQKPEAEIHYLTKSAYQSLLVHNPYIDKLHLLEEDLNKTIAALKQEKFDCIIDLHRNLRTLQVKRALNTEAYSFPKLNIRKWILVNFRINLMPEGSIVDRYFETVKQLGVKNDHQGLDYFVPEGLDITHKDLPMSHWAGYVGCVIGGSYNTKKLPVEKWQELIALIPYPVILIGGPEDREEGRKIAAVDPIKMYNACGKFDLNESSILVKRSRVVISNDTGLMHIAAAYQKPVVSLWGNTSPELGMFPYFGDNDLKTAEPKSLMLERKHLGCHPCSKLGYSRCPRGHFKCMRELDLMLAAEWIKKQWNITQL